VESFYALTYPELDAVCQSAGIPAHTSGLLYNWHHKKAQSGPCVHHNMPRRARVHFADFDFQWPSVHQVHESPDKTVKFVLEMRDGRKVETVLIPFQDKYTVCLSSQVGCAMGCAFCYTGTQGLKRHLQTEEIVGQFLTARRWLLDHRPQEARILNIVYMGQGEPLHNLEAVAKSARIFMSQHGLSLAGHKITVSTAGFLPGLECWRDFMPDVNPALSLHSPFDEKRDQLIPLNRKYKLAEIIPLIDSIPQGPKRFVTYEYLLLAGFNDGPEDAHATGRLLSGRKAYINLIPFNPFPGSRFARPSMDVVMAFKDVLDGYQIPTLIRSTKGDEILAACGQLHT
jgi:23S rRNA (adenine2503-C2)-methyltransferase